jgi:hypothetical protein
MFDTRAFNLMLDGSVPISALNGRVSAYATHIQRDEINNTKNPERRAALLQVFNAVVAESVPTDSLVLGVSRVGAARLGGNRVVPTASAVWDVSRWDQATWGADDNVYSTLKSDLDKLNKSKRNNVQDALIAETSIKGQYVLITDDEDLVEVTKKYGGRCLSLDELLNQ